MHRFLSVSLFLKKFKMGLIEFYNFILFYLFLFIYLFWLHQVLVAARGIFVAACRIFFFFNTFIYFYLFIFGCIGSLLLCVGFL